MRWVWRELHWSGAPIEGDLSGVLRRLAADDHHGPLVFEARVEAGQVRYLLGGAESSVSGAVDLLEDLVATVAVTTPSKPRQPVDRAGRLRIKQPDLPLGLDPSGQALRALLAALGMAKLPKEVAVLQVVLGAGVPPRGAGARPQDPNLTLFDLALYGARPAGNDVTKDMKAKVGQYRFRSVVRLGVAAADGRRQMIVFGVLAALRQLQTASAKIELLQVKPEQVDEAIVPPRKPLRLTAGEALAFLAWPVGERELPGLPPRHPVLIAPPSGYRAPRERIFATATAPGSDQPIGIGIRDALRHTHLMGPTGVGKSTLLLHLIAADITAGRSVVVIDPKRDLGVDVLSLIPESRRGDVVLLDPSQPDPVGLNPLADVRGQGPLVADGLLAIFKGLFPSMFGPRTSDAFHAALLTLATTKGSTLADLPRLFTDVAFQHRLTAKIDDPLGVGGFWAQYEAMSAGQQAAVVGPVLTRLRQFLLRAGVKAVIDQPAPRFRLDELFTSPRIFIITLNKGLLGPEAAALLGSIVVSQLWQQTLARAARPKDDRVPVSVYIDEAQTFLHLADLAEALEQSRSLGVAWHLAHQHRAQMPGPLMAAIDSNTRSKILFTVDPSDAGAVTKHSRLTPEDVTQLPPYEIYANLEHHGGRTGWLSARTLPPPEAISDPTIVAVESRARYGRPPAQDDARTESPHSPGSANRDDVIITTSVVTSTEIDDEPIGRRRKATP